MRWALKPSQLAVIHAPQTHGPGTVGQIAEQTGMSEYAVRKAVYNLKKTEPPRIHAERVENNTSQYRVVYRWNK